MASCSYSGDSTISNTTRHADLLVYIKNQQLYYFDPTSDISTTIAPGYSISEFSFGKNNRLAFSAKFEGNDGIYVIDFPFRENNPMEIISNTETIINSPISWSPNGDYLLIKSIQDDIRTLSVWDGLYFIEIFQYYGRIQEVTWSDNGWLAFTEFDGRTTSSTKDPGEVYIWNGTDTVSVSQNPNGNDRFPSWSNYGQLAFTSNRNDDYDIFVWDGVSYNNSSPDISTFENIASSQTEYYSNPVWTNKNTIAFQASKTQDINIQIYEWDGQSTRNISKNPFSHNGGQVWRKDGYWSFITYFSLNQNLFIRDEANRTILKTKAQYRPAWSQNGSLVFCVPNDSPGWKLTIWNGVNLVEVTQGGFIIAKWNNGTYVYCSYG